MVGLHWLHHACCMHAALKRRCGVSGLRQRVPSFRSLRVKENPTVYCTFLLSPLSLSSDHPQQPTSYRLCACASQLAASHEPCAHSAVRRSFYFPHPFKPWRVSDPCGARINDSCTCDRTKFLTRARPHRTVAKTLPIFFGDECDHFPILFLILSACCWPSWNASKEQQERIHSRSLIFLRS